MDLDTNELKKTKIINNKNLKEVEEAKENLKLLLKFYKTRINKGIIYIDDFLIKDITTIINYIEGEKK